MGEEFMRPAVFLSDLNQLVSTVHRERFAIDQQVVEHHGRLLPVLACFLQVGCEPASDAAHISGKVFPNEDLCSLEFAFSLQNVHLLPVECTSGYV